MKHRLILIAAVLALLCTGLDARDSQDIRLLYWNIQNGMWSDQDNNYDNFVAYVKNLNPDICVWCEGASIYKSGTAEKLAADDRYLPYNWDSLAERYGHKYVYVGGWRDNYPQVVTSKFPIRNVKRILGDPDDIIVSHGAAWVQIEVQGQTLNLVTLHTWPQKYAYRAEDIEASAKEQGGDKYRAREMEYICKQTIGSVTGASGQFWMMMGDFNSRSRVDAKQYDLPEDSPAYLVHDYIKKNTPYRDIIANWYDNAFFPSTGNGKRIDFVYATSIMYSCIRATRILGDEGWMTIVRDPQKISNFYHPSDHRPIMVDFNLSGESSKPELKFEWNDLERGAQWARLEGEIFGQGQCISVLRYPMKNFTTEVANDSGLVIPKRSGDPVAVDPQNPATTPSGFGARYDAFAAMNGSYFNMRTLYPTTYVRDAGVQEGSTDKSELFRVNGLVAFKGHKVKIVSVRDTTEYASTLKNWPEALASGPILIKDGVVRTGWEVNGFNYGRHPRSVIGTKDGWVYLIVIDGRFHDIAEGTTIAETAEVARQLGLTDALNLDGGGSSALWSEPTGVISHPFDNCKYDHAGERIVPNAVIVR